MAKEEKIFPDLEDDSLMPSGKWKNTKMKDVPDDYLLYIYENDMAGKRVSEYIEKNLEAIKKNVSKMKDKREDRDDTGNKW